MEPISGVEVIAFPAASAWESWLAANHERQAGVWLMMAKKGSGIPSVTDDEVVDIGLCFGWVSGQRKRFDDDFYLQKYVPRRPMSLWSRANVDKVETLLAAGRMREPGMKEVRAAQADGRWHAAYESQRNAMVPPDVAAALDANEKARSRFDAMDKTTQYRLYLPVLQARTDKVRAARLEKMTKTLEADQRPTDRPRSANRGPPSRPRLSPRMRTARMGENVVVRTHVALLRGVNVGGKNKVAMADLRELVASLDYTDVVTHLNSGNVAFTSDERDCQTLAGALERAIVDTLEVAPAVVVVTRDEVGRVIADNPFPDETDPKCLHAVFRAGNLDADEAAAVDDAVQRARDKGSRDEAKVVGRTLYLRTPDGLGRSELAKQLSRSKGSLSPRAATTARNWATVTKLLDLCDS